MPLLHELPWPRVAAAFERSDLVIVPIGSTEQHGPHLPVATDFLVAEHIAGQVGDRLGALVAPVLPFGFAAYHLDFAGTITLDEPTLRAVLLHTCRSLMRHGARHFVVVNGHGGNTASAESVALELADQGALCAVSQWWELAQEINPGSWRDFTHAGIVETAAVLAIRPELVDLSAARPNTLLPLSDTIRSQYASRFRFRNGTVSVRMPLRRISANGHLGEVDPAAATPELGREILGAIVEYLVAFTREFASIPVGG
jgi:creatinine amidohydrolase